MSRRRDRTDRRTTQHKLAKQRVVSAYALANEKLILGERGGNTRRLIDQFFSHAGVTPKVAMELSRLAAIKRMVEEDMGVGIVPLQSVRDEVAKASLVRWWIEGAEINWQLGLARLVGGVFLVPFLWFLWRGWIEPSLRKRLWTIFGLGAALGVIGGGCWSSSAAMRPAWLSAANARSPVTLSYRIAPNAKRSARASTS